jgi:hypothetical protein
MFPLHMLPPVFLVYYISPSFNHPKAFVEAYRSCSPSLCSFSPYFCHLPLLDPNTVLSTLPLKYTQPALFISCERSRTNSVPAAQRRSCISISKTILLKLFEEILVCCVNTVKQIYFEDKTQNFVMLNKVIYIYIYIYIYSNRCPLEVQTPPSFYWRMLYLLTFVRNNAFDLGSGQITIMLLHIILMFRSTSLTATSQHKLSALCVQHIQLILNTFCVHTQQGYCLVYKH